MFSKAKNYVGHNVHLKEGVVMMKKAKDALKFKDLIGGNKAAQFAKINEYVSEVLSTSHVGGFGGRQTEASMHMFNLPCSVDQDSSAVDQVTSFNNLDPGESSTIMHLYNKSELGTDYISSIAHPDKTKKQSESVMLL